MDKKNIEIEMVETNGGYVIPFFNEDKYEAFKQVNNVIQKIELFDELTEAFDAMLPAIGNLDEINDKWIIDLQKKISQIK